MVKNLFFLIFAIFSFNLIGQNGENISKKDLKKLYKTMIGHYTSEVQSKQDSNFFNIHLNMVPLWKKNNEYYLYVEQASASALEKPYRQRVYHLYMLDNKTIVSKVYELKDAKKYINAHKNKSILKDLTENDLIDRVGCAIYLNKNKNVFKGSTPGKECLSSLRGATYATSEVEIYKDKLISWDRGWDNNDLQVWGSNKGGYIFVKQ